MILKLLISLGRLPPYFRHVLHQALIQPQLYHSLIQFTLFLECDVGLLQLVLKHLVLEYQLCYLSVFVVYDALQFLLIALELQDYSFVMFFPMVYGVFFFGIVNACHLQLHSQALDVFLVLFDLRFQDFQVFVGLLQLQGLGLQFLLGFQDFSIHAFFDLLEIRDHPFKVFSLSFDALFHVLFTFIELLLKHFFLFVQILLLPFHCLLQLLILALIKLHSFKCLFLLNLHFGLMLVVQCPQFSILILEEAGLIAVLDHGFHESHAKGHILITNALDVEFELLLNSMQFYLQLPNQVLQGACFDFPSTSLFDLAFHLCFIIFSESVVLIREVLDLSAEDIYLVIVYLHHFSQVVLILFSGFDLQEFVFPEKALHLFFQSAPHQQRFLEVLDITVTLKLIDCQLFNEEFSVIERYLQCFYLLSKGLVFS